MRAFVVRGIPRYRIGSVPALIPRYSAVERRSVTLLPDAKIDDLVALMWRPDILANRFITSSTPSKESDVPFVKTRMSSAKHK